MYYITAPNVASVQAAIEYIYPLVYEFRKERTAEDELVLASKKRKLGLNERNQEEFLEEPNFVYESVASDVEEDPLDDRSGDSWD